MGNFKKLLLGLSLVLFATEGSTQSLHFFDPSDLHLSGYSFITDDQKYLVSCPRNEYFNKDYSCVCYNLQTGYPLYTLPTVKNPVNHYWFTAKTEAQRHFFNRYTNYGNQHDLNIADSLQVDFHSLKENGKQVLELHAMIGSPQESQSNKVSRSYGLNRYGSQRFSLEFAPFMAFITPGADSVLLIDSLGNNLKVIHLGWRNGITVKEGKTYTFQHNLKPDYFELSDDGKQILYTVQTPSGTECLGFVALPSGRFQVCTTRIKFKHSVVGYTAGFALLYKTNDQTYSEMQGDNVEGFYALNLSTGALKEIMRSTLYGGCKNQLVIGVQLEKKGLLVYDLQKNRVVKEISFGKNTVVDDINSGVEKKGDELFFKTIFSNYDSDVASWRMNLANPLDYAVTFPNERIGGKFVNEYKVLFDRNDTIITDHSGWVLVHVLDPVSGRYLRRDSLNYNIRNIPSFAELLKTEKEKHAYDGSYYESCISRYIPEYKTLLVRNIINGHVGGPGLAWNLKTKKFIQTSQWGNEIDSVGKIGNEVYAFGMDGIISIKTGKPYVKKYNLPNGEPVNVANLEYTPGGLVDRSANALLVAWNEKKGDVYFRTHVHKNILTVYINTVAYSPTELVQVDLNSGRLLKRQLLAGKFVPELDVAAGAAYLVNKVPYAICKMYGQDNQTGKTVFLNLESHSFSDQLVDGEMTIVQSDFNRFSRFYAEKTRGTDNKTLLRLRDTLGNVFHGSDKLVLEELFKTGKRVFDNYLFADFYSFNGWHTQLALYNLEKGKLAHDPLQFKDYIGLQMAYKKKKILAINPEHKLELFSFDDSLSLPTYPIQKTSVGDRISQVNHFPQPGNYNYITKAYAVNSADKEYYFDRDGLDLVKKPEVTAYLNAVSEFKAEKKTVVAKKISDNEIDFCDTTGRVLIRLFPLGRNDWAFITDDDYYMATPGAMRNLSYSDGKTAFSFEQLDLQKNRPDIVIQRLHQLLNIHRPEIIELYKKVLMKRWRMFDMGQNREALPQEIPDLEITNEPNIPNETASQQMVFEWKKPAAGVRKVNVYLNNVPVDSSFQQLKTLNSANRQISLDLLPGMNKIELCAVNDRGQEGLKHAYYVKYNAPAATKSNLYVVTIGVSTYAQAKFNLRYPAKDARDMADALVSTGSFAQVNTLKIADAEFDRGSLAKIRTFLQQAGHNDVVLLYYAGHGVLDANLDYYLSTSAMDFDHPAEKGVKYDAFEQLLTGIKPVKKFLLLDACHSGEIDKAEVDELAAVSQNQSGNISFRAVGKNVGVKTSEKETGIVMRQLFNDLRRGAGATVLASAGGAELAMESAEWKNGLFTYCFLKGLKKGYADFNNDHVISFSELQKYTAMEVTRLSNGAQTPTTRFENTLLDVVFKR